MLRSFKSLFSFMVCALAGCQGYYDTVDLTNTAEVRSSGLVGEMLTLKQNALLARRPWEQYSELFSPSVFPPPYDKNVKVTGTLAQSTVLQIVNVRRQEECDGFWQWPRETAVAEILSGPKKGIKVVVAERSALYAWTDVLDDKMFGIGRPPIQQLQLAP